MIITMILLLSVTVTWLSRNDSITSQFHRLAPMSKLFKTLNSGLLCHEETYEAIIYISVFSFAIIIGVYFFRVASHHVVIDSRVSTYGKRDSTCHL